jgi:outer membrane cobalamin receptor
MRFYDPRPGARLSPFSGKSVKRERGGLSTLATTTSGEAFIFEPGIDLIESGSAGLPQALRVRGSRPGDVMYLMDGIRVSDDRLGIFDVNWLPLAAMEGAEVAMNGQSGLYGSGATSGVMNLKSMSAMPEVPMSEVAAWWGSFDSKAVHFRFNRRITSRFGILLAFENLHSGGWVESSTANANKFYGKLTGYIGRSLTYELVGYRYDGSVELPDSCPALSWTSPSYLDNRGDFVKASLIAGSDATVSIDYYYIAAEHDYKSGDVDRSGRGRVDGLSVASNSVTGDSSLTSAGIGYRRFKTDHEWEESPAVSDVYGYVAGEKRFQAWRLRGSLRVERTWGWESEFSSGTELAGDLAATLQVGPWGVVFGRIDRSFSYPGIGRCWYWSGSCPGDTAEHWNSVELGTDLGLEPVRLSAAVFWRQVDNSTLQVTNEACEGVPVRDKELSYLGAEALISFTYPAWIKGSFGYSAERARDGEGKKLSYVPSGAFTWDLRAHRKFSGHVSGGLTFAGRWVGPFDVGNQMVPCSGDECLADAELDSYISGFLYGYIDIDSGRVYARIRNLFNQGITRIWGHPELPPRSFELGVNLELFD